MNTQQGSCYEKRLRVLTFHWVRLSGNTKWSPGDDDDDDDGRLFPYEELYHLFTQYVGILCLCL